MVGDLPLSRYERIRTTDADELHKVMTEVLSPHGLFLPDGHHGVDARFHSARAGSIGLHYVDYGADVRVTLHQRSTFYLVEIPLTGTAKIGSGEHRIVSNPMLPFVSSPGDDLTMHWPDRSPKLIVWIERAQLEERLRRMLGRSLTKPVRFDLGMDHSNPAVQAWRRVVDLLVYEMDVLDEPIAMPEVEQLLLSRLLLAQPNNYSGLLHRDPPRAASKPIKRAQELIEAHAAEPLSVEDIAEAVGLSVRSLQEGFKRCLGTTPMHHLREVRLLHAHADLTATDPTMGSVTDIALRWGFLHAGRFSVVYRERFGLPPSATLRR